MNSNICSYTTPQPCLHQPRSSCPATRREHPAVAAVAMAVVAVVAMVLEAVEAMVVEAFVAMVVEVFVAMVVVAVVWCFCGHSYCGHPCGSQAGTYREPSWWVW